MGDVWKWLSISITLAPNIFSAESKVLKYRQIVDITGIQTSDMASQISGNFDVS